MTSCLDLPIGVIAHRGASAYAPENTMAAFCKAAQLGVTWVEFDVMLTGDDVPIVFHDETLERITGLHGNPEELSYAYLQTLDAGQWFNPIFAGERIPTLAQVLDFLTSQGMHANIEIKSSPANEIKTIDKILETITTSLAADPRQFLFSSFSVNALTTLRALSSDFAIGLLLHEWESGWQQICENLDVFSVHVNEEIVKKASQVNDIKAMHKALFCYTVNSITRARELFQLGVDAVFSDVPDKILSLTKG